MADQFLKFDPGILPYIERYYNETEVQVNLRKRTAEMAEAVMQISPGQAALMQFLTGLLGVERYLEIGVFTGYSSLSVALAMPDSGRITACDISEEWTGIGRQHWQAASVDHKIDLVLGPANKTLENLLDQGLAGSYDLIFIDADKENYDTYYTLGKQLLHKRGLMLIDNTLWSGRVADPSANDPETVALRNLNLRIQKDPEVTAFLLPLGDGLTLVRKTAS